MTLTADVVTASGFGPALTEPDFPYRHYGVNLSPIGEDGDLVAFGHVEKRRALAAFNRHSRVDCGLADLTDGSWRPDRLLDDIRHTWAVRLTICRDCRTLAADPDCLECKSITAARSDEWAVEWGDEFRDVAEAFPVTLWVC